MAEGGRAGIRLSIVGRYGTWRAAWQRLFGYDFFISYAWSDGRPYAEALERGLAAPPSRFRCFIDQKDMGGGEAWRASVRKALRRSSVMVLVASSAALERDNVFEEIETFSTRNRPLIPIELGARIGTLPGSHRAGPYLEERLRFEEQDGLARLARGEPSTEALNFLSKSFGFVRVGRLRSLILVTLVGVFAGLAVLVGYSYVSERAARQRAQLQELRALAILAQEASAKGDQPTAMLLALEALPEPGFGGKRPLSYEAAAALHQAWLRNRETALTGHHGLISSASFSRDGTHVVTASEDSTARVWDLRAERPSFVTLEGHKGPVRSASFSPDGTRVLTSSEDGTARVWDWRAQPPSFVPLGGDDLRILSASFSADGLHVVTGSGDGTARVWDWQAQPPSLVPLVGHHNWLVSASFSADGTHVVTASTDEVRVWDWQARPPKFVRFGDGDVVESASFNGDGTHVLTFSSPGSARLWDLRTTTPTSMGLWDDKDEARGDRVDIALFSPDGTHVATVMSDGAARVWDLSGEQPSFITLDRQGLVVSASFSADGKHLLLATYGTSGIWDLSKAPLAFVPLEPSQGQAEAVVLASLSPDGTKAITSRVIDGVARVWDLREKKLAFVSLDGGDLSGVSTTSFSADGSHVVTGTDHGEVRLWDVRANPPTFVPLGRQAGEVVSALFSPDGNYLLTAEVYGGLRVWDTRVDPPSFVPLEGNHSWVRSAAFSPDGTHVVAAHDYGTNAKAPAMIWDWRARPTQPILLEGHEDVVNSARFSPDGADVLTSSDDGTARVWDWRAQPLSFVPLEGHQGRVFASFSADGTKVVTASDDKTARLWDWRTKPPSFVPLEGHASRVASASFSADGTKVVTASDDGTARVWNLHANRPSFVLLEEPKKTGSQTPEPGVDTGIDTASYGASFNFKGTHVLTTSIDDMAKVWDLRGERPTFVALEGHQEKDPVGVVQPRWNSCPHRVGRRHGAGLAGVSGCQRIDHPRARGPHPLPQPRAARRLWPAHRPPGERPRFNPAASAGRSLP